MKSFAFLAATAILTMATAAMARDSHHHHRGHSGSHHRGHIGGHHLGGHGYHHAYHRSHYGHHRSGFSLYLGWPRYYGSYSYPRSYSYSYPYSYSYGYYSSPSYRSYSYSYPSCVVGTVPVQPRVEAIAPNSQPRIQKVEPAPEPVPPPFRPPVPPPPEPQPNTASFDAGPYRYSSVSNVQQVHHSQPLKEPTAVVTDENPQITALGLQLSAPNARSLISDESIPFIVPSEDDVPVAPVAQKPDGLLIPQEMKGIKLLPVADQRLALAQRTCPVTGDLLGSDGKPFKVSVRGQTAVFVCCDGCIEDLQRNPDAFLGKK